MAELPVSRQERSIGNGFWTKWVKAQRFFWQDFHAPKAGFQPSVPFGGEGFLF